MVSLASASRAHGRDGSDSSAVRGAGTGCLTSCAGRRGSSRGPHPLSWTRRAKRSTRPWPSPGAGSCSGREAGHREPPRGMPQLRGFGSGFIERERFHPAAGDQITCLPYRAWSRLSSSAKRSFARSSSCRARSSVQRALALEATPFGGKLAAARVASKADTTSGCMTKQKRTYDFRIIHMRMLLLNLIRASGTGQGLPWPYTRYRVKLLERAREGVY